MAFASIGDICVDTYPDKNVFGGTAYNSALAARKYGIDVSILSAIGDDENGEAYKKSFQQQGINSTHVHINNKPTSTVHITLKNNSPIFGKWELGALEDWILSEDDVHFLKQHDIAKMICLKPLEKNFQVFCSANMPQTIKAGDFDGNSQYSFSAKEIKNYIDGLDVVIKSLDIDDIDAIDFLQQLAKEKNKIILITLGKNGSMCFAGDTAYRQEVEEIVTANTTGFGDIFIAAFLITYNKTKNIQEALKEATQAVVIS